MARTPSKYGGTVDDPDADSDTTAEPASTTESSGGQSPEDVAKRAEEAGKSGAPVDASLEGASPAGTDEFAARGGDGPADNLARVQDEIQAHEQKATGETTPASPASPSDQDTTAANAGPAGGTSDADMARLRDAIQETREKFTDTGDPGASNDLAGVNQSLAVAEDAATDQLAVARATYRATANKAASGNVRGAAARLVAGAGESYQNLAEIGDAAAGSVDEWVGGQRVNTKVTDALTTSGGVLSEDQEAWLRSLSNQYRSTVRRHVETNEPDQQAGNESAAENLLEGGAMGAAMLLNAPQYVVAGETALETAQNAPGAIQKYGAGTVASTAVAVGGEAAEHSLQAFAKEPAEQTGKLAAGLLTGRAFAKRATSTLDAVDAPTKAKSVLSTDADESPASSRRTLGSGGAGSLLDAEAVDDAMGKRGPSPVARVRGAARRTRSTVADEIAATRTRLTAALGNRDRWVPDDRGQAQLVPTGTPSERDTETDTGDAAGGWTSFDESTGAVESPGREVVLEGGPRDQLSDDVTGRALTQRRQHAGDYDGRYDPVGGANARRRDAERMLDVDATTLGRRDGRDTVRAPASTAGAVSGALGATDATTGALTTRSDATTAPWSGVGPVTWPRSRRGPARDQPQRPFSGRPDNDDDATALTTDSGTATDSETGVATWLASTDDDESRSVLADPEWGRRTRGDRGGASDATSLVGGRGGAGLFDDGRDAGDALATGWVAETVTAMGTRGISLRNLSDSALQTHAAQGGGFGELPTYQMVKGSAATQARIADAAALLSGRGVGISLDDARESSGWSL